MRNIITQVIILTSTISYMSCAKKSHKASSTRSTSKDHLVNNSAGDRTNDAADKSNSEGFNLVNAPVPAKRYKDLLNALDEGKIPRLSSSEFKVSMPCTDAARIYRVQFKTPGGYYLSQSKGAILAFKRDLASAATFTLEKRVGGHIALKSTANGKYLAAGAANSINIMGVSAAGYGVTFTPTAPDSATYTLGLFGDGKFPTLNFVYAVNGGGSTVKFGDLKAAGTKGIFTPTITAACP